MKKCINIDDRTFKQLNEYCNSNKLDIQEYICNALKTQLYTDIYGDMNEMRNNKNESLEEINLNDVIKNIVVDRKINKTTIYDTKNNEHIIETNKIEIVDAISENINENKSNNNDAESKSTVRIKRQLQVK